PRVIVPMTSGTAGAVQTVPGPLFLVGVACPSSATCFAAGNVLSFTSGTLGVIVPITTDAISATNSTAAASPASVPADGTTASTVTVMLKDSSSNPARGDTVTLAGNSGTHSV